MASVNLPKDDSLSDKLEFTEPLLCSECDVNLVKDYLRGELICRKCGLVEIDNFAEGMAGRATSKDEHGELIPNSGPSSYLKHDKGLSSVIGSSGKDAYGSPVPARNRQQLFRMRRWDSRFGRKTHKRSLYGLNQELLRLSSLLCLPRRVKEVAALTCRRAMERDILRGRSITSVAAAALYLSCRRLNVPKNIKCLIDEVPDSKRTVRRCFMYLKNEFAPEVLPFSPIAHILSQSRHLSLDDHIESAAIDMVNASSTGEAICNLAPTSVAAASVYLASVVYGANRTQKYLAQEFGCTEVTLRKACQKLLAEMDLEIRVGSLSKKQSIDIWKSGDGIQPAIWKSGDGLPYAINYTLELCNQYNLNPDAESAATGLLFRRGSASLSKIVAAVYLASKSVEGNKSISLRRLVDQSGANYKTVFSQISEFRLVEELEIKSWQALYDSFKLSPRIMETVKAVEKKAYGFELDVDINRGRAGAVLYFACKKNGMDLSQKIISERLGIHYTLLSRRYTKLNRSLE